MRLKQIVKISCLLFLLPVCALILWVTIGNGRGNTVFSLTLKKWDFYVGDEWYLMDTNGLKTDTIYKSKIGPILIEHYEPVIRMSTLMPDGAANQSQPIRAETNRTSAAAVSDR